MAYQLLAERLFGEFLTNGQFDGKKYRRLSSAKKNLILLRAYRYIYESQKKRSKSLSERTVTQDHKDKISQAMKGNTNGQYKRKRTLNECYN